jgi:hypothetical protein
MKLKRVYYHYLQREEFDGGMWRVVAPEDRDGLTAAAADLMRDPGRFYSAMLRAQRLWPRSCEAALTADPINKRAWLGHAGCCVEVESPEDLTRAAWNTLGQSEQDAANAAADRAIEFWMETYVRGIMDRDAEAQARN